MTVAMSLFYCGREYYYEVSEDANYYEIKDSASTHKGWNSMTRGGMAQIALRDINATFTLTLNEGTPGVQLGNNVINPAAMNQYLQMDPEGQVCVYLTVADQEAHLVELPQNGRWVVGRRDADVVIPLSFLEENHCTIVREKGVTTIFDNNSEAGLYLNGVRTTKAELRKGDVVSIRTVQIMLHENGLVFRNVGPAFSVEKNRRKDAAAGKAAGKGNVRRISTVIALVAVAAAAVLLFGVLLPMWTSLPMTPQYIATGGGHTLAIREDGTVAVTGDNADGRCDVQDWKGIIAVSAGANHTVGLKKDGTVVAVGLNRNGQRNVGSWKDIAAISAGAYHTVGLKKDGTVVAKGANDRGQTDTDAWRDIVAISAGAYHTVGLKSDGTVVATGSNDTGEQHVGQWKNVIAITAGQTFTACLKSDGTVAVAGFPKKENNEIVKLDVSNWVNIVAISAGNRHLVGLRSDGTVVATGDTGFASEDEQLANGGRCAVSSWRNIVAIAAGHDHTVGLRSDGTVVAVGYVGKGAKGSCDVFNWRKIRTPK